MTAQNPPAGPDVGNLAGWHPAVTATVAKLKAEFAHDSSGHDWWHIYRVWQMARRIALSEGADRLTVELAALLHDIADWKFHDGDLTAGPAAARAWLQHLQRLTPAEVRDAPCSEAGSPLTDELIDEVSAIVAGVTYKGAGVATEMPTLAGRCVQDADRLDAIGAIGIARAFAFGGHFGRLMYDPDHPAELHQTFADYRKKSGPTINHFYEKLLLLKDRMQTATGRQLAAARHQVLEEFLAEFFAEWHGER